MKRFYKFAVHCILTFVLVFASVEVFSQGIVGTTSANGVNIIFQDGFNASSLDLTGTPRDITKWTKSNESGSPANPTISTALWGTHNGYNSTSTHWLSQTVATNVGVYLWSPQISLPAGTNLVARFSLRTASFTGGGTFTIGTVFDGNNDQVPDGTPAANTETFTGSGPYNDYAGSFYTTGADRTRLVNVDLSQYGGLTGRIGILLKHTSLISAETYQIDWFIVGTRPVNDLCGDAIALEDGVNGGTNGYYNTTASGLVPSLNTSSSGPPDSRTFFGGSCIYIGSGANGTGAIPVSSGIRDGFEPALVAPPNLGPFGVSSATVENSTWYKFTTPDISDCSVGTLTLRITIEDLSCARNSTNVTNQLQLRVFNSGVCGTTSIASTYALNLLSTLNNNGSFLTPALSYNTTYFILVDGVQGNDCRFKIKTETLVGGVVQTGDCVILPITLKDFTATPEEDGTVSLNWVTLSERNNDFFTVERSTDGVNYVEIHKQAGAGNSTTEQVYGAVDFLPEAGLNYYRLKQTDFDGNFEYFDPVAVNVIPSMLNMTLIPNPTSRDASVLLSSRSRQHIQLQVYDITGKFLFQVEDYINEGNTSFSLPSEKWNSGTYLVRVVTDKETITEKLIVNL